MFDKDPCCRKEPALQTKTTIKESNIALYIRQIAYRETKSKKEAEPECRDQNLTDLNPSVLQDFGWDVLKDFDGRYAAVLVPRTNEVISF